MDCNLDICMEQHSASTYGEVVEGGPAAEDQVEEENDFLWRIRQEDREEQSANS